MTDDGSRKRHFGGTDILVRVESAVAQTFLSESTPPSRFESLRVGKNAPTADADSRHEIEVPFGALRQVPSKATTHQALYIEAAGGKLRAWPLGLPDTETRLDLAAKPPLEADAVPAHLLAMLTARGLTEAEASALIDCWRGQFFQTAGRRVLMLLNPEEYDSFCPLHIRPAPTKLVRVGIVLTEL